jgi:hypothetical protein
MNKATHSISPELVKAYCEADYVIHIADADIALRVGKASPKLAELMRGYEVNSAAYLTAFNPFSALLSSQENELNQSALVADIHSLGLKYLLGEGKDVTNLWASEASALALGISFESAELLAERYKQNAFLWISSKDAFVSLNLRYPITTGINAIQASQFSAPRSGRLH